MQPIARLLRAAAAAAVAVALSAASVTDSAQAREWMPPQIRAAAESMLSGMPDDWYTIKDVAAEKEIATGVPFVIDVREPAEFAAEHIARAKNIALRSLLKNTDALPADKTAPILVYCTATNRLIDVLRANETADAALARLAAYGTALPVLPIDDAMQRYEATFKSEPVEITEATWHEMLGVLPPVGWRNGRRGKLQDQRAHRRQRHRHLCPHRRAVFSRCPTAFP